MINFNFAICLRFVNFSPTNRVSKNCDSVWKNFSSHLFGKFELGQSSDAKVYLEMDNFRKFCHFSWIIIILTVIRRGKAGRSRNCTVDLSYATIRLRFSDTFPFLDIYAFSKIPPQLIPGGHPNAKESSTGKHRWKKGRLLNDLLKYNLKEWVLFQPAHVCSPYFKLKENTQINFLFFT